jgi:hypothetical protein
MEWQFTSEQLSPVFGVATFLTSMINHSVIIGPPYCFHGELPHVADQADTLVIALSYCYSTAHQPTGSTLSGTVSTGYRDAVHPMGRDCNMLPDRGQYMELSLLRHRDHRRISCA